MASHSTPAYQPASAEILTSLKSLQRWVENRQYAGFDPYDWLNSPVLSSLWEKSRFFSSALIQAGRRFGGLRLRRGLRVSPSTNPKAIGLFISGYCDITRCGQETAGQLNLLKCLLKTLRDSDENEFAWGYDWNFASMRGGVLPAFNANSIATVFCADALLDVAELFADSDALEMGLSAARFCATRLNRSFENSRELCFSYTPGNNTLIFNSSVLVGALLARAGACTGNSEWLDISTQTMRFLVSNQHSDGSWAYGCAPNQQWIDGFHTGYNLSAMAAYRRYSGDAQFDPAMMRGYEFYKKHCFDSRGTPKYFHDCLYPIDIHACSQAVLTLCDFCEHDPDALERARQTAVWTIQNMQSSDGSFYYQAHRMWTNRTPYMRWGQAWMFRSLARLSAVLAIS